VQHPKTLIRMHTYAKWHCKCKCHTSIFLLSIIHNPKAGDMLPWWWQQNNLLQPIAAFLVINVLYADWKVIAYPLL
jgi:hypothetical protein